MKQFIKALTSLLLILTLVSTCLIGSYAASNFTTVSQFNNKSYTHYGVFANTKIKDMIDVSEHNGLINFYKFKALGIDDVIIRVGCRGYGSAGSLMEDNYYYDNVENAMDAGINVGLYFYSQALTTAEAVAEANFCLKRVSQYKISLPIFYDYEFAGVSSGRLDKAWANGTLNKTKMTNNAVAFCETIKKAGYKPGVYGSSSFYTEQLNTDLLYKNGYEIWNAYYTQNSTKGNYWPNKNPVYKYWQYGGANVQGSCGDPSSAWLKVKYAGKTGYVSAQYIDFTGAEAGVSIIDGLNLRKGAGTGYDSVTTVPFLGQVAILSYPTNTASDVNFYYSGDAQKPNFSLSATGTAVTVSWKAVPNAAYYRVYSYDKEANKYERLAQVKTLSFTKTQLRKATEYTFLVRTFFADGSGNAYKLSDNKSIITAADSPKITLKAQTGTSLHIAWTKVQTAAFYRVYSYDAAAGKYTRLAQVNATEYTLENLSSCTQYTLLVRAFNDYGVGSEFTEADHVSFETLLAAPEFSFTRYSYSIKISWKAVNGAAFYRVYQYNPNTKKYILLAQTEALSWQHDGIKPNTSFTYLVRAFRSPSEGNTYKLSDNKSVKTLLRKPAFSLSTDKTGAIRCTWNKVDGAAYYRVYLYNAATKKYRRIAQTAKLSFTYTDTQAGKEYIFLVRAFESNGDGSSYSAANHKSIFAAIQKARFSLSSAVKGQVGVNWEKTENAAFYRLYRYDSATRKYQKIVQTGDLKYTVEGLKSGGEYTCIVRAYTADGIAADYTLEDNQSIIVK